MKKIILAAVLFLPFLVSCSQNRKAPDVSPQTICRKSEKTETAKVQYLTTSDFRKRLWITRLIRMNGYSPVPVLPSSISIPPGVVLARWWFCSGILAEKYAGKIDFYKVDIDQSPNSLLSSVSAAFLPSSSSPWRQTICRWVLCRRRISKRLIGKN